MHWSDILSIALRNIKIDMYRCMNVSIHVH